MLTKEQKNHLRSVRDEYVSVQKQLREINNRINKGVNIRTETKIKKMDLMTKSRQLKNMEMCIRLGDNYHDIFTI